MQLAKKVPPGGLAAALRVGIPYTAVAAAGTANMLLMRRKELTEGVNVTDADGKVYGMSQAAGQKAVALTVFSRAVFFPIFPLLLPPVIMAGVRRTSFLANYPRMALPTELGVIAACLWGTLPPAIAIFPQQSSIAASSLEPQFHGLVDANGKVIDEFYFNKVRVGVTTVVTLIAPCQGGREGERFPAVADACRWGRVSPARGHHTSRNLPPQRVAQGL